jgi:plastocyanin
LLAFVPAQLQMPAATSVTVNYLNDSSLEHNINFFAGTDSSAPSLGATARVVGPAALESVTFTTPDQPGDYYFWCDVHFQGMAGTYTVTP